MSAPYCTPLPLRGRGRALKRAGEGLAGGTLSRFATLADLSREAGEVHS